MSEATQMDAESTEQRLRAALEAGGHRFTTQRAAVFQVLEGRCDHPTADEIFTSVRDRIPDISLATVYKALEAFVSCDVARKLTIGEGPARYDRRTDEHHHVRCVSCGSVADVEDTGLDAWFHDMDPSTDFEILDYRLELLGHCPRCRS